MDRKTELQIIKTLTTAGHQGLAKTFAQSRGYRVAASGETLFVTVDNLTVPPGSSLKNLTGWMMSRRNRGPIEIKNVKPSGNYRIEVTLSAPDDSESTLYAAEKIVIDALEDVSSTYPEFRELFRDFRDKRDVKIAVGNVPRRLSGAEFFKNVEKAAKSVSTKFLVKLWPKSPGNQALVKVTLPAKQAAWPSRTTDAHYPVFSIYGDQHPTKDDHYSVQITMKPHLDPEERVASFEGPMKNVMSVIRKALLKHGFDAAYVD